MSVELDHLRRDALLRVHDSPPRIVTRWLGRMNFADALALQEEIVAQKRSDPTLADTILLLEHDPVYTIGRTPDQTSLRGGSHLPHPFFQIAIAIAAISALTKRRRYWLVSMTIGAIGCIFLILGFVQH